MDKHNITPEALEVKGGGSSEAGSPSPAGSPEGGGECYRCIDEGELADRFEKLRAENAVVRSLCNHFGYGLEGLLADFAKKNPKLRDEVMTKLGIREVTIYVDAPALAKGEGR